MQFSNCPVPAKGSPCSLCSDDPSFLLFSMVLSLQLKSFLIYCCTAQRERSMCRHSNIMRSHTVVTVFTAWCNVSKKERKQEEWRRQKPNVDKFNGAHLLPCETEIAVQYWEIMLQRSSLGTGYSARHYPTCRVTYVIHVCDSLITSFPYADLTRYSLFWSLVNYFTAA